VRDPARAVRPPGEPLRRRLHRLPGHEPPEPYIYGTPTDKSIAIEGSGDDALAKPFIARVDGRQVPEKGSKVFVHPKAAHLHVFNKETGERLTS
jgi:hypothetical protein